MHASLPELRVATKEHTMRKDSVAASVENFERMIDYRYQVPTPTPVSSPVSSPVMDRKDGGMPQEKLQSKQ